MDGDDPDRAVIGERPTPPAGREPVLDLLRGFALLGILMVNVALMRSPDIYPMILGDHPPRSEGIDRVVEALVAWLANGKFVASFALLFGVGAGLMVTRAMAAGRDPHGLLARRFAWLLAFGLAHMLLLFPGDILFVYGLTGLVLLAFLRATPRTALAWSVGLLAAVTVVAVASAGLAGSPGAPPATSDVAATGDPGLADEFSGFVRTRGERALTAFTEGSYLDVIAANAWQALLLQSGQVLAIPWLLALFLGGFAISRAGIVLELATHRVLLRRLAWVGLGVGLPLNGILAVSDPLALMAGVGPQGTTWSWTAPLVAFVQQIGAPLLAIGYLAALAAWSVRRGAPGPLVAVGRMALTGYVLQSLLALVVFAGLDLYGRLDPLATTVVVVGIWAVLLLVCPLWLRWFRFGPLEWLWRTLTYGRRPPMRRDRGHADPDPRRH